mmetsp:Transcript_31363/g.87975  ORF Transcript_31363/g.87975 Transcript_31363/m.87975 type:complete len:222 (+) Transcript_31363:835-1500(+)
MSTPAPGVLATTALQWRLSLRWSKRLWNSVFPWGGRERARSTYGQVETELQISICVTWMALSAVPTRLLSPLSVTTAESRTTARSVPPFWCQRRALTRSTVSPPHSEGKGTIPVGTTLGERVPLPLWYLGSWHSSWRRGQSLAGEMSKVYSSIPPQWLTGATRVGCETALDYRIASSMVSDWYRPQGLYGTHNNGSCWNPARIIHHKNFTLIPKQHPLSPR